MFSITRDVVIRTNTFGTKLVIDGKPGDDGDNVTHYGYAAIVDIVNVANASYDECGTIGRLKVKNGHIEVMNGGEVFCLMEVGGSSTVETTVNEGGIVHDNKENINASTGITKDDEGVANGLVDDCGPGKHSFSEFVDDDNNTYDVCTCCGYCLVHVKDASGTEIKQTLNKLVEGENGRYVVQEVDGAPKDTITPVLNFLTSTTINKDNLPKENVETTTHIHDYRYTSNSNGTHNGTCNCGEDPITDEACDTSGANGVCSKCGYKAAGTTHTHNYEYTSNNNGTHKKACKCGEGTVNDEPCDSNGKDDVCSKCGYIYGDKNYLTFTAITAGSKVIPAFDRKETHSWQYSINGGEWKEGHDYDVITLTKAGDYVKLKGTGCKGSYSEGETNYFTMSILCSEGFNISDIYEGGPLHRYCYDNGFYEADNFDEYIAIIPDFDFYYEIAGHFFMTGSIEASGSVSSLNGWNEDADNLDDIFYACGDVLSNTDYSVLK